MNERITALAPFIFAFNARIDELFCKLLLCSLDLTVTGVLILCCAYYRPVTAVSDLPLTIKMRRSLQRSAKFVRFIRRPPFVVVEIYRDDNHNIIGQKKKAC